MKFAVLLSGCGVFDGSEIHEAVLTLLALSRRGVAYRLYAPDMEFSTVNHLSKKEDGTRRNALVEAARIARGEIRSLKEFVHGDVDGLILPGGFGAAKNLCTFATEGITMKVRDDVLQAVRSVHEDGKPIGALCIAPVLLAKILGARVTIGDDPQTAKAVEALGGRHEVAHHGQVVADAGLKVFTSPCYMLESTVAQIADDAQAVVDAMIHSIRG